ncbi:hypothetical protein [Nocardioides sp.]|uniref:hypothetical protein n=1 Tax=Nocardioides sp. TaxID=35761 RepID=UPI003D0C7664
MDTGRVEQALHDRALNSIVDDGSRELDRPHVVVITLEPGMLLVEGPYDTGAEAASAADRYLASVRSEQPPQADPLTTVVPLTPAPCFADLRADDEFVP